MKPRTQTYIFPPPPVMVTVEKARLDKMKRLLKYSRSDRRRQAQCIADMKADNARLYSKLNECGWGLDGRGQWKTITPSPAT